MKALRLFIVLFLLSAVYGLRSTAYAQNDIIEANIDFAAATTALPKIFKPSIDLSGRGISRSNTWPQGLAAEKVIATWGKDIGFKGIFRLQYDLWEIHQKAFDKDSQDKLLANYEKIIKDISDAGGIVLLDIFGTPAGLGKVLDKNSPPWDLKAFKELIKRHIKFLSCEKKYNIWYEVWSAPDLEDFFLGRKQEYLNMYRAVAECVQELEAETKTHISIGGPGSSCWFQNLEGNTIITPERSLIYEWIKFCYVYHLPIDFISWHSYSTSPSRDQDATTYKKNPANLIRDWLTYFNFQGNTPLIIDEWNFDRELNLIPERGKNSYIASSYIPSRLKNMFNLGIDYQVYFCLEDFDNEKEGLIRNMGAFWFDHEASEYKGGPKSSYSVFRMLGRLDENMLTVPIKNEDEFLGMIATKAQDELVLLVYNYIDPEIARNFLSKNIASLNEGQRKILLNFIKSSGLVKVLAKGANISALNLRNRKVENLLKKARQLSEQASKFKESPRIFNLNIKNLRGNYVYQKYSIDSSCGNDCGFTPEEKEIEISDIYKEELSVKPYSVTLIIFKNKPKPEPVVVEVQEKALVAQTENMILSK